MWELLQALAGEAFAHAKCFKPAKVLKLEPSPSRNRGDEGVVGSNLHGGHCSTHFANKPSIWQMKSNWAMARAPETSCFPRAGQAPRENLGGLRGGGVRRSGPRCLRREVPSSRARPCLDDERLARRFRGTPDRHTGSSWTFVRPSPQRTDDACNSQVFRYNVSTIRLQRQSLSSSCRQSAASRIP